MDMNILFIAVSVGVALGVMFTIYTKELSANMQKAIVAVGAILTVIAALSANGQVAAPAIFLAFDAGYVAGVAFETNSVMRAVKLRLD